MVKWMNLCGNKENWDVAIQHRIWGVKPHLRKSWNELLVGDVVFFYVTRAAKRIVGVGEVKEKLDPTIHPPSPLWPDEIREGRAIYPYRFRFETLHDVFREGLVLRGISTDGLRLNRQKGMSRITDEQTINELHQRVKLNWNLDIPMPIDIVPRVPLVEVVPREVVPEEETLRRRIAELEEKLREKDRIITSLAPQTNILTGDELQRFSEHEQATYKLGLVLKALNFNNVHVDLPSKVHSPPFTDDEKTPYRVRDKEYDVKGEYEGKPFVFEVHDKGLLVPTLVKLNELTQAYRALVLLNAEDERELRREMRRPQFRNLLLNMKVYLKDEVEAFYKLCKNFHILMSETEIKRRQIAEMTSQIKEKRRAILEKPPYIEQILL